MKYTIEILRWDGKGAFYIMYRESAYAMSPKWARAKAERLLNSYKPRGANGARITNQRGEELYNWRHPTP